jgi:hypothetical protein
MPTLPSMGPAAAASIGDGEEKKGAGKRRRSREATSLALDLGFVKMLSIWRRISESSEPRHLLEDWGYFLPCQSTLHD